MDRLAALAAFVSVVEAGGFAAAGRRMELSRSAVNRLVIALEDELGAQLLNRTTRKVAPTSTGAAFYDRAKRIIGDLDDAVRSVGDGDAEPRGELRINAPMSFGTLHLASAIADFMVRHPALRVRLDLNDRFVDIVAEGFDLTVRIAAPDENSNLVDFRIGPVRRAVCAAPALLRRLGTPDHPDRLADMPCLHYGNLASGNRWHLSGPDGDIRVTVNGVLCSNNGEVLRDAAVRGLGFALLPTFIVGRQLQTGELVTVLPEFRPPELMLCVVYPPNRHLSAGIRLFTDFMVERFGGQAYWDLVE
ncbi:MAG: LysR family transcriptional regulator [Rhodospirillaceae bacterium]